VTLPRLLADEGYACGLSGKLHLTPTNPEATPVREDRIDDGYHEFHWSHDPNRDWPTNEYHHWLRDRDVFFEQTPVDDSEYVQTSVPAEHHQTTWCVERALDFVHENKSFEMPWLFSVNIFDPHHPFDPPEAYLERYRERLDEIDLPNYEDGELDDKPVFQRRDHQGAYNTKGKYPFQEMDEHDHRLIRAAYLAMVDLIDDQVGRLLDALEETGQRENTIVIFGSDHGEMLGDHGIYLKGPYFYEPAIRVPLIVSWPGEIPTGRRSSALVELTDLAPTLLEATGHKIPERMQGRSFWPLLQGETDSDDHRDNVYAEFYHASKHHTNPRAYGTMVRTDRYKLVAYHGVDMGELYDLERDPDERENLWDNPDAVETKTELLTLLTDRMAETADPLPERQTYY
jgi:arylsulfatase A-like enzyme